LVNGHENQWLVAYDASPNQILAHNVVLTTFS
jgi:hypothetical protein